MNNSKLYLIFYVYLNYHQTVHMLPQLPDSFSQDYGNYFRLPDISDGGYESLKVNKIIFPVELEACPPPLGTKPSPGCNKTFVEDVDGEIPCHDDLDCPENRNWFNENGCHNQNEEIITVGNCLPQLKR